MALAIATGLFGALIGGVIDFVLKLSGRRWARKLALAFILSSFILIAALWLVDPLVPDTLPVFVPFMAGLAFFGAVAGAVVGLLIGGSIDVATRLRQRGADK